MLTKIEHLPIGTQKQFYKDLTAALLEVFATNQYEDVLQLQQDFDDWKRSDLGDYHTVIDDILSEIAPEGIKLTWRDLGKLNYKRWKICSVCGKPYIDVSKFNKTKICYTSDYKRYKIGTEDASGSFFKSAQKGLSECFMVYKNQMAQAQ